MEARLARSIRQVMKTASRSEATTSLNRLNRSWLRELSSQRMLVSLCIRGISGRQQRVKTAADNNRWLGSVCRPATLG